MAGTPSEVSDLQAQPSGPQIRPSAVTAYVTRPSEAFKADKDLEPQIEAQEREGKKGLRTTLWLTYGAVGVALGDLGTSPIYTLSSVFSAPPTEDQVLGAMSIIFWGLTLVVICKYMFIVLFLDDHGEGGTFALYSLLARFMGFTPGLRGEPLASDLGLERYSQAIVPGVTGTSAAPAAAPAPDSAADKPRRRWRRNRLAEPMRHFFRTNHIAQTMLLLLVLLMTSLVIGDGVLTPAQTVLGAFGAIKVKAPNFAQSNIAGISMAVLALLFAMQPLGTKYLGALYAPILLLWFLLNVIVGVHNIHTFYPGIGKAINPYYLYRFFTTGQESALDAWKSTATIFLCLTGAEASYADLGHFSKASIRAAFLCVLYPSVIIAYFGQSAWIIKNPEGYATSFFSSVPWSDGFFYFYFVVAVAAACVASQTMVSAAFSIVKQSMMLNCFPRMRVIYTNVKVRGQLWVPFVMIFMGALCIAAVGIFQNSVALGFSYGVCVSTLMMGTDLLAALAMVVVWELPLIFPIVYLIFFGFVDGVFFTANLTKIPLGGWFAVSVASGVMIFSLVFFIGNSIKRQYAADHKALLRDVVSTNAVPGEQYITNAQTGHIVTRLPGLGLFYTEHVDLQRSPTVLTAFIKRMGALPEVAVLLTVRQVPVSSVSVRERLLVREVPGYPSLVQVVARYGYLDKVDHRKDFLHSILDKVQELGGRVSDSVPEATMYITISAKLKGAKSSFFLKRYFIDCVYSPFAYLASVKASDPWDVPDDMLVELGVPLAL